jgi:hypothetical protein
MKRMSAPLKDRPELSALLAKARTAVESMTPEEKRLMHETQRKSWVIGELMLEHPEMTREQAEKLYEAAV